ncbi:polyphosphate kinase 1 [Membranihabitans marinus]|uniref:polyphosphate kinase 1 n=1 Tax=Membranihabitans marinus TaxID=1227546 RepID=UPI001F00E338|nr:polyphosphate kinase 1 [Membranihabitans marinus]
MKETEIINRDISWLSFNARVLQEAKDHLNPLFERIKFLAIYSSNLGEYFAVRVSQHRNLLRLGKKEKKELHLETKDILEEMLHIVKTQQIEVSRIFDEEIVPHLEKEGIRLLRRLDLSASQRKYVEDYFHQFLLPYVQPVLLVKDKVRPFLNNAELYLVVDMIEKMKSKELGKYQYGIVKIPSDHIDRFIQLPSDKGTEDLILLDDVVRHSISWLFPGYDIIDTYSIKLTRDAELYIDDEFSGDLVQKIKDSLTKRNIGPASRLVYDREMPKRLVKYLQSVLEIEDLDLIPEGRYHNNFDYFKFPHFGKTHLQQKPLQPLVYSPLENTEDIFETIKERDHLLMFPFHEYESVIRMFEEAAEDPNVTHIKIIQYRVAKESRIMNALMRAAKAGKNVTAFVEVKARFDEEANLNWAAKLEQSGVKVHYSFPGLKVHSKSALIRRIEGNTAKLYTYLSTGNFNEDTAEIYSDFGLFTVHDDLCQEISRLFSILETVQLPNRSFKHILVGQFNLKSTLIDLIRVEIANALNDLPAEIFIKINSIQDEEMIDLLYQASQAGVKVKIIVRGICCIIPGRPNLSENIEIISIIDRYLEHARIFRFHNNGQPKLYFSSADWMTRNLNYRIETAIPIYDENVFNSINDIMELQWKDNVKARKIDEAATNSYIRRDNDVRIQSQIETYYYFKRQEEEYLKEIEVENDEQSN